MNSQKRWWLSLALGIGLLIGGSPAEAGTQGEDTSCIGKCPGSHGGQCASQLQKYSSAEKLQKSSKTCHCKNDQGHQKCVSSADKAEVKSSSQSEQGWCRSARDLSLEPGRPVQERTITILHVNDVHGSIEPGIDHKIDKNSKVGGLAWLATLIKNEQAKDPKSTILLNGGDLAEGSMISYMSKGVGFCKALHSLNFDAVTLGNHEFSWGQEALANMLEALDLPVVNANIEQLSTGMPMKGVKPYRIIEVEGVKVGILGLDTPDIRHFIAAKKLDDLLFRQSADTVKWYLPLMRQAGADLCVVLSHIGYEDDLKLAQEVPGIDLIVGAHSHTVLPQGQTSNNILIAQAGFAAKYLGKVQLQLVGSPGSWRLIDAKAQLIPVICDQIEPDKEVERILKPYCDEAAKMAEQVVAQTQEEVLFAHRSAAKLNQIHADSILEEARTQKVAKPGFDEPGQEKPLFGICNSRSLRGSLPKGEVTYKDVYAALPFTEENYVTMRVSGQMVLDEIEDDLRDKATELAVPCGLSYTYSLSRPEGHRLIDVRLADGTPLDPQAFYTIVSNETMSRKAAFKNAQDKRVLGPVQPLFFEAVKRLSPLKNDPDNRVEQSK